jgi:hypothetical protein
MATIAFIYINPADGIFAAGRSRQSRQPALADRTAHRRDDVLAALLQLRREPQPARADAEGLTSFGHV